MAYSTIVKPSVHFNTKLFTGTGSDNNAITGVGFQPDWIWFKNRSTANDHAIVDAVRGANKATSSNNNASNYTLNAGQDFDSFNSDGFTVDTPNQLNSFNKSGDSIVTWNWKANGQGSANTAGSINTTYTSVNTTAGFSISKYDGTGSVATIGHGLGATPNFIIVKRVDGTSNWYVYHSSLGATQRLSLNETDATSSDNSAWNDTAPTNTLINLGTSSTTNKNGGTMVAYAFAEKQGYSKFGKYTGNGNADGSFIYTGFKPAFVIAKMSSGADDWRMITQNVNTRNTTSNEIDKNLYAQSSAAESSTAIDFVSNGMKIRSTSGGINSNGQTFIYMAFAEEPLVANSGTNGVPATAR